MSDDTKVVTASRVVAADHAAIFEWIADPAKQPEWDANDNLAEAAAGQRVRQVGDTFLTLLTMGSTRENHVVEFEEGRLIAWRPAEPGQPPPGHLWRWELEPQDDGTTRVVHTYDWTELTDPARFDRARADHGRQAAGLGRSPRRDGRRRLTPRSVSSHTSPGTCSVTRSWDRAPG